MRKKWALERHAGKKCHMSVLVPLIEFERAVKKVLYFLFLSLHFYNYILAYFNDFNGGGGEIDQPKDHLRRYEIENFFSLVRFNWKIVVSVAAAEKYQRLISILQFFDLMVCYFSPPFETTDFTSSYFFTPRIAQHIRKQLVPLPSSSPALCHHFVKNNLTWKIEMKVNKQFFPRNYAGFFLSAYIKFVVNSKNHSKVIRTETRGERIKDIGQSFGISDSYLHAFYDCTKSDIYSFLG